LLEDESTLSLIPAADQILVVCRAGLTSRSDLAETLEILESAHDQISGAVLTMTSSETA
jgi:Mrp family chromosome partitioning ATPase